MRCSRSPADVLAWERGKRSIVLRLRYHSYSSTQTPPSEHDDLETIPFPAHSLPPSMLTPQTMFRGRFKHLSHLISHLSPLCFWTLNHGSLKRASSGRCLRGCFSQVDAAAKLLHANSLPSSLDSWEATNCTFSSSLDAWEATDCTLLSECTSLSTTAGILDRDRYGPHPQNPISRAS